MEMGSIPMAGSILQRDKEIAEQIYVQESNLINFKLSLHFTGVELMKHKR